MKKTTAFLADKDDRTLYHTARAAREAEFRRMVRNIFANLSVGLTKEHSEQFADELMCGRYRSAADALINTAIYLETHKAVLDGTANDPEERDEAARDEP